MRKNQYYYIVNDLDAQGRGRRVPGTYNHLTEVYEEVQRLELTNYMIRRHEDYDYVVEEHRNGQVS